MENDHAQTLTGQWRLEGQRLRLNSPGLNEIVGAFDEAGITLTETVPWSGAERFKAADYPLSLRFGR
jgi:hypothetical protein